MLITRDHMIQAVKTEPLFKGHWVSSYKMNEEQLALKKGFNPFDLKLEAFTGETKNCPVCAVGGALRVAGLSSEKINKICAHEIDHGCEVDLDENLEDEHYLAALSSYFEGDDWVTRDHLVEWIKEHVPEDWSQDVFIK